MRIAHLCLSCFYIDDKAYQENELVRQHVADGHDVLVIASTESHSAEGRIAYVSPGDYLGAEGARVIRLPYLGWPHGLARKLRMHPRVMELLDEFQPDSILFHGACGWELLTAARYARRNPSVPFYIDSHEDWNNSARSFVSREVLHRMYYRSILRLSQGAARKILCVTTETMEFVEQLYGVPKDRLEFFPLGGRPIPENEYADRRNRTRAALGLRPETRLFIQSGKQTRRKRLLEALKAFQGIAQSDSRFLIVGSLHQDIRAEAEQLLASTPAAAFLGWKSVDELTDLLCAADVYVQPGTQSATMQHSLCCHCAVILDNVPAHKVYQRDNGWFVSGSGALDNAFLEASRSDLADMSRHSFELARAMLDYRVLANRVLPNEVPTACSNPS